MITVKFYETSDRGNELDCKEYATADGAFVSIARSGLDAIAYPTGTLSGMYLWRHRAEGHGLVAFRQRMEDIAAGNLFREVA